MMSRVFGVFMGCHVAALGLSAASAEAQVDQSVRVARWQGVSVSDAQIDQSFQRATQVVAKTCAMRLSRRGEVLTFAKPTSGSMASDSDWEELYDAPGYLKIVKTITRCGGSTGSYAGCSAMGWPAMIMEAVLFTREQGRVGRVLAHEFGHTVGFDDEFTDLTNLMAQSTVATNDKLSSAQCATFRTPVDHPEGSTQVYHPPGRRPPPPPTRSHLEALPIAQLARTVVLTSVPMGARERYDRRDAAELRALLVDPREVPHHANAIRLLGVISDGDEVDAEALIAAAESGAGRSQTSAALIGLGYLANRGNRHALDHLAAQLASDDAEVAGWAIQALGVSGRPEAALLLRDLERDDALVAQALADNAEVARVGLDGYYAR